MSTMTTNIGLTKPELTDPADITAFNANWDTIDTEFGKLNGRIISLESANGVTYTASDDAIPQLSVGLTIVGQIKTNSTSTAPTLNLNNFGAKTIRQPLSTNTGASTAGLASNWLARNSLVLLTFNGTYWIAMSFQRTSASNLYGAVPIANGGTGATTAEEALTNLGNGATIVTSKNIATHAPGYKGIRREFNYIRDISEDGISYNGNKALFYIVEIERDGVYHTLVFDYFSISSNGNSKTFMVGGNNALGSFGVNITIVGTTVTASIGVYSEQDGIPVITRFTGYY